MGRKQMPEKITLTKRITIRVSEIEYSRLSALSESSGLSLARLVRMILVNRKVKIPAATRYDYNMINELRRQGGLLKKYYTDAQGANSELTRGTLNKIDRLIGKLLEEAQDR